MVGYSYENQYRFVFQTGLRTGELAGLKWSDIDFKNRTMKIERTMEYRYSVGEWRVGPPKSKSGYRTIPLTDEAIRILKKYSLDKQVLQEMTNRIQSVMEGWTKGKMRVEVIVFSNVFGELGKTAKAEAWISELRYETGRRGGSSTGEDPGSWS